MSTRSLAGTVSGEKSLLSGGAAGFDEDSPRFGNSLARVGVRSPGHGRSNPGKPVRLGLRVKCGSQNECPDSLFGAGCPTGRPPRWGVLSSVGRRAGPLSLRPRSGRAASGSLTCGKIGVLATRPPGSLLRKAPDLGLRRPRPRRRRPATAKRGGGLPKPRFSRTWGGGNATARTLPADAPTGGGAAELGLALRAERRIGTSVSREAFRLFDCPMR